MARTRLDKTLADYVVIAISPALIMTLVGSLCFFLMEVCYRGQFESRLHWIMFWFVFAAVLVARIAIEEGREHAQIFGIVMCALTAIAVLRFVDAVWIGWVLLAVVWGSSSKLTWDCTLIDDDEDASGEGLLQAVGFDKSDADGQVGTVPVDQTQQDQVKATPKSKSKKAKKSKRTSLVEQSDEVIASRGNVAADDAVQRGPRTTDSPNKSSRPHAPGSWVIYFSLASLPLFGIGQLFIPIQESGRRSYAFQLLAVYVASAMALLLATSFLGLRRYLRQRKLEMPTSMTRSWLGMGAALLVALLLLALIIPRPQGEYTLTAMIDKIDAKSRQASRFAALKGDRAKGEGRRIGEQDNKTKEPDEGSARNPDDAQTPDQAAPGGKTSGNAKSDQSGNRDGKSQSQSDGKSGSKKDESQSRDRSTPQSKQNEKSNNVSKTSDQTKAKDAERAKDPSQQAGDKKAADENRSRDQRNNDSQSTPNQATPSTPSTSAFTSLTSWIAPLIKCILYGLLVIVGLYFLIRHWTQITSILTKLWAEFLSLFLRRHPADQRPTDQQSPTEPKRPFASYENPFFSGAADRMSPRELISYTFEAMEAWSREQAVERPSEQTPLEFAQELGRRVPALAKEVAQTAQLYTHAAYARKPPSRDRLEVLERLWRRMGI